MAKRERQNLQASNNSYEFSDALLECVRHVGFGNNVVKVRKDMGSTIAVLSKLNMRQQGEIRFVID
jgi:hypothetical protein